MDASVAHAIHHPTTQQVERLRKLSKQWREGDAEAFRALNREVAQLSPDEHYHVARAFANFLALANTAETHNKVRRLRDELAASSQVLPLPSREDSCLGNIERLLKDGVKPEAIYHALTTQKTELVLTAHPTEVNRRTYLNKHKKARGIRDGLGMLWLIGGPVDRMAREIGVN